MLCASGGEHQRVEARSTLIVSSSGQVVYYLQHKDAILTQYGRTSKPEQLRKFVLQPLICSNSSRTKSTSSAHLFVGVDPPVQREIHIWEVLDESVHVVVLEWRDVPVLRWTESAEDGLAGVDDEVVYPGPAAYLVCMIKCVMTTISPQLQ